MNGDPAPDRGDIRLPDNTFPELELEEYYEPAVAARLF